MRHLRLVAMAFALFVLVPSSFASEAAPTVDRDPASSKHKAISKYDRFQVAFLTGPAIHILSGSPNASGAALGLSAGLQGSWSMTEDHALKFMVLYQSMGFHSDLPGTAYDVNGMFTSGSLIYNYYFMRENFEPFMGGGLGVVSQTNTRTKITNNTLTSGLTEYPNQSGMLFQLEGGFNWKFSDTFYVPAQVDFIYYTTSLAQGTPLSIAILGGIGMRF